MSKDEEDKSNSHNLTGEAYAEQLTMQSAVHRLGDWLDQKYQDQVLSNTRIKALFSELIPNYGHICDALTRSSGRPPKGGWTKAKAIGFYQELIDRSNNALGDEELILCAVLLRYQKGHQGNAVDEYWNHKMMVKFMAENPQKKSPSSAAHALAKKLNADPETKGQWRQIDFYRSYMLVEAKKIPR